MNDDMQKNNPEQESGMNQVAQEPAVATPPQENPTQNAAKASTPHEKSSGPLIGIIIIVLLLIVGGYYYWVTQISGNLPINTESSSVDIDPEAEAVVADLQSQGTSDEVTSIEADLNTTELDSLDAELTELLNEF